MSVGIRHYKLTNNGIGTIIWPQLRAAADPTNILWDGRNSSGYSIAVGLSVAVDLGNQNLPENLDFFLSENTYWGKDQWETQQAFHFDPASNLVATAERWGPIDGGYLEYVGTMPYTGDMESFQATKNQYASLESLAVIEEVFNSVQPENDVTYQWAGTIIWLPNPPPFQLAAANGALAAALTVKGYYVKQVPDLKNNKNVFVLGFQYDSTTGVPKPVVFDWNIACDKVAQLYPKLGLVNKGITEIQPQ